MPTLSWAPLAATLTAFALLAVLPGFLLTAPFQRRTPALGSRFRWVLSFIVGFAVYSCFADYGVKWLGANAVGFAAVPILAVVALAFFSRSGAGVSRLEIPSERRLELSPGQMLLAALFALVVIAQVVPVRIEEGVYWGTPEMDWRSRVPTINAIARDGLPAANPFFDPDGRTKLFFYYAGFLLPAGVVNVMKGGAITVLTTYVFVLAFCVASLVIGFANSMFGDRRAGWIAGACTFVTGLDLLPVLTLTMRGSQPMSIEWWNPAQVTAMTAFPVWVPHHTVATLEVLAAHILLWQADARSEERPQWGRLPTIAVVLAGAMESSTYVGLLGFASLSLHGFLEVVWHRQSISRVLFPAGCVVAGVLLAAPFYASLAKIDRYVGRSIAPILRPCPGEEELAPALTQALGLKPDVRGRDDGNAPPKTASAALFLVRAGGLVPQYFIEFGVFFVAAVWWKRTGFGCEDRNGLWRRLAVMCWAALLIGSIFVSVRTWNCDLNWRILHPVQIALAATAGGFLLRFFSSPHQRIDALFLIAMIGVGAVGSLYDWNRTRADYPRMSPELAVKAERAERVASVLNAEHPWSLRIQYPIRNTSQDPSLNNPYWMHYLRGSVVVADDNFNVFVYGVDQDVVRKALASLERAFDEKTVQQDRSRILKDLGIEAVILEKESPLFDRDVATVFGEEAKILHEWPDCRVVGLAGGSGADRRPATQQQQRDDARRSK